MADPKDILIVEDGEENLIFISEILEEHGYGFREARNGREAMAALEEKLPDLVLLDIMMPRKSGLNVYRDMKKDEAMSKVPVIFVTGASQVTGVSLTTGEEKDKTEDADEMMRRFGESLHEKFAGIEPEGLVEKPIDPAELVAKIREIVG
jgi:twitching motility two-component system response regulator PilH